MKEYAILLAAGMGMRMRPLTEKRPKPLIEVNGKPMIETIVEGLQKRLVDEIFIVTGYMGEQFEYLKNKYSSIHLIKNSDYQQKNNISSIYAAREVLGKGNCFICESDLYVADNTLFMRDLKASCYFGRMQQGYSDDWVFDYNGNEITRIGKGGLNCYNMVGISYFLKKDAFLLKVEIEKALEDSKNDQLFWDEVVNRNLDKMHLTIEAVKKEQIIEIDTVEELNRVNESF